MSRYTVRVVIPVSSAISLTATPDSPLPRAYRIEATFRRRARRSRLRESLSSRPSSPHPLHASLTGAIIARCLRGPGDRTRTFQPPEAAGEALALGGADAEG